MKYRILILAILFTNTLTSQLATSEWIETNYSCECDVVLISYDFYTITSDPDPFGDLDEFMVVDESENCTRSVYVLQRYFDASNEVNYRRDNLVNSIQHVMERYRNYSSICFKGNFRFTETIDVGQGKTIRLIDGTSMRYVGLGDKPAVDFTGHNGSLDGSGTSEIVTGVAMNEGLVRLTSEGTTGNNNNRFFNQIKNIDLVSEVLVQPSDPRDNRAIHLSNTPESILDQTDNGTNYHTNIYDIKIDGFATGVHIRGWSNTVNLRKASFEDIEDYGVWMSGCIDNTISDIAFRNCSTATAIRLDNYVDERYSSFTIGDQTISLTDPNQRELIKTAKQLSKLLSISSNTQESFNENIDEYIDYDALSSHSYYAILESCGLSSDPNNPFRNEEELLAGNILNLKRFGLKGYGVDDDGTSSPYANFPADGVNSTQVSNDPKDLLLGINFYKDEFNHATETNPQLFVDYLDPTCLEFSGLTSFFLRPAYNSFSMVNIFDGQGNQQVSKAVELSGREDGLTLCQKESEDASAACDECEYEFRGEDVYTLGLQNKVFLCPPNSQTIPTITNLTNNTTTCSLTPTLYNTPITISYH